ncbi:MAG: hypothetical protein H0X00_12515 [Sporichthya sp.]|nr:hypothetical protein [Sporichthya sp.]
MPFTLSQPRPRGEGCEMCNADMGEVHSHVVNIETRSLLCTCRPCYLLFTHGGAGKGNFRSVPDRYLVDPDFQLSHAQWEELQVPVAMAFFFQNSAQGRVIAQYPSPAGATESLLDLTAWDTIVRDNPLAAELAPDVEALIVYRTKDGNASYLVPIDACYELVGRVRMHWTGFDGGPEARKDIADFFERVARLSRPLVHSDGVSRGAGGG